MAGSLSPSAPQPKALGSLSPPMKTTAAQPPVSRPSASTPSAPQPQAVPQMEDLEAFSNPDQLLKEVCRSSKFVMAELWEVEGGVDITETSIDMTRPEARTLSRVVTGMASTMKKSVSTMSLSSAGEENGGKGGTISRVVTGMASTMKKSVSTMSLSGMNEDTSSKGRRDGQNFTDLSLRPARPQSASGVITVDSSLKSNQGSKQGPVSPENSEHPKSETLPVDFDFVEARIGLNGCHREAIREQSGVRNGVGDSTSNGVQNGNHGPNSKNTPSLIKELYAALSPGSSQLRSPTTSPGMLWKTGTGMRMASQFLRRKARFVDPSFQSSANADYDKRGINIPQKLQLLDELNAAAEPISGEDLEGNTFAYGERSHFITRDFISNPEIQIGVRLVLANDLFYGCLGLPIYSLTNRNQILGVAMLYLPYDEFQSNDKEYLIDNPELHLYLAEWSTLVSMNLLWRKRIGSYRQQQVKLQNNARLRARQLWRKLRSFVKSGSLSSIDLSSNNLLDSQAPKTNIEELKSFVSNYCLKWKGQGAKPPPKGDGWSAWWTFIGSFLGLLVPSLIQHVAIDETEDLENILFIGSYGALATLLYAAPASPFAQPRLVIGGHLVSLLVAITLDYFIDNPFTDFDTGFIPLWLGRALVPALSIAAMNFTGMIHPPAAACAVIFITGGQKVKDLAWMWILLPAVTGCLLMVLVALAVNNLSSKRKYPQFW